MLMHFTKGFDNTVKTVSRVVAFLYGQLQAPLPVCFLCNFCKVYQQHRGSWVWKTEAG